MTAGGQWQPDRDDPRLTGERVRVVDGSLAPVTLVGAVHDHPASVHRAAAVVERVDPDVLALELPPIALPLFERHAVSGTDRDSREGRDDGATPSVGGEMTAAIRAAETDRVVGIDGPSASFLASLATTLAREKPAPATVRNVLAGVRSAGSEALRCRLAVTFPPLATGSVGVAEAVDHDCTHADAPRVQAADEDRQISRARAVMDTFEPSRASQFRDATREVHMADRLASLRREDSVVAVVGYGHLDAVADRLRDRPE